LGEEAAEQNPSSEGPKHHKQHAMDYFGINTHVPLPDILSKAVPGLLHVHLRYKSLIEARTAQPPPHAERPPLINKPAQPPAGRVASSLPCPKLAGVNNDARQLGFSSLKRLCRLRAELGAAAAQLRGLEEGR